MTPTHAVTANGRSTWELTGSFGEEFEVRRGLEVLDAQEDFAASLWRLPKGKRLWDGLPAGWPYSFIQSAGSSKRMTVEVRFSRGDDGVGELYAVGHPVRDQLALPLVRVPWGDLVQTVFENEVFDAKEAGDIYWHYYKHDAIPEGYAVRKLNI